MKVPLRRLIVPGSLAVALVSFGCVSAPEAEKAAAEQAVSAAKAAGADKYATSDFAAATDALKAAESRMVARKYSEAKGAYVKTKELAEKAVEAVSAGKAALKSEVEQELGNTEKRWREVEGKINGLAKKLKAEQKQAWDADSKATREALQAAKAATADDPASAKDKLAGVLAATEKWESEVKALATPAKEVGKKESKK